MAAVVGAARCSLDRKPALTLVAGGHSAINELSSGATA
jgi:hypothetical protein